MRICIVDDDVYVRDSLAFLLRDAGHEVLLAGDAAAALQFAKTVQVDAVLADYDMPGMKGDALAVALRAQLPDLIIVLSSGRPMPRDAAPGAIDVFLPKPFTPKVLLNALAQGRSQRSAST